MSRVSPRKRGNRGRGCRHGCQPQTLRPCHRARSGLLAVVDWLAAVQAHAKVRSREVRSEAGALIHNLIQASRCKVASVDSEALTPRHTQPSIDGRNRTHHAAPLSDSDTTFPATGFGPACPNSRRATFSSAVTTLASSMTSTRPACVTLT